MKNRSLAGVGLALLFCFFGSVKAEALSVATAEGCAKQWASCVGQGQANELAKILDDSYQHTHGTGLVENREEFLGALRSGARKYEPIQLEDVKTRLFGECAVVTGKFALKVSIKGKISPRNKAARIRILIGLCFLTPLPPTSEFQKKGGPFQIRPFSNL